MGEGWDEIYFQISIISTVGLSELSHSRSQEK